MRTLTIRIPQVRVLAGIGAGVLIGVIGVGAVTAAPGSQVTAASTGSATTAATTVQLAAATTTTAAAKTAIRPGAFRALIRNDYRVTIDATNKNGARNILYVRGDIAIGSGTVTVTLPDSSTQVFTTNSATVVREQGNAETLAALESGERAMVFGTKNSDGTYTAVLIRCIKEAATTTTPGATSTPSN